MANFNLNDYDTVQSRISKFYADHENGRIRTELIKLSDDFTSVIVQAFLYDGSDLLSTGLAMEIKGQNGFANKDSWLENCETSAIGRALANHDYSGDLRPSREEMSKTQHSQNNTIKTTGNYDSAKKYLDEQCNDINSIDLFISMLSKKTWAEGDKEKLLMFAQNKKAGLMTNAEKVAETFNGEIAK